MHSHFGLAAPFKNGSPCLALLLATLWASEAGAVNWEQQAERLARVSATLLDGLPIAEPAIGKFGLGLKFDTSFLPKPNTTVGAKKEKVPSSPIHAVPTLKGYGLFSLNKQMKLGFNLYAGYLMPGVEGLLGVKAKLSQLGLGGGGTLQATMSRTFALTFDAGLHMTSGEAKGAITAANANDVFTFKTMAYYVAPGVLFSSLGIWSNVMLGMKNTEAQLKIPADETTLKTQDTIDDAPLPVWFQIAAGWRHAPTGVSAGLAYLVVPARLYMPRLHLAAIYPLGGPSQTASSMSRPRPSAKEAATAPRKNRSEKAPSSKAPKASKAPSTKAPKASKGTKKETLSQEEVAP